MKTPRLVLLTALVLASISITPLSPGADFQGDGKWVSLFNGKDLSGWVIVNNGAFTVTNGILHLERSMGWLRSDRQYTDFILEAEWRALETNYNSGFFIRAGLEGKPFPASAWQVNLKESSLGSLLKGRETVLPSKTPKFPVNEWVTFRMEVRGKKLTLDVNGARAWEFNGLDVDHGYIGIQAEGKSLDFRSLRVLELGIDSAAGHN
jgi:3-keto-disaccharide hydrolase